MEIFSDFYDLLSWRETSQNKLYNPVGERDIFFKDAIIILMDFDIVPTCID